MKKRKLEEINRTEMKDKLFRELAKEEGTVMICREGMQESEFVHGNNRWE